MPSFLKIAGVTGWLTLDQYAEEWARRGDGDPYFRPEFIAAGALAVALAIVADIALVALQRVLTPWARAWRTV